MSSDNSTQIYRILVIEDQELMRFALIDELKKALHQCIVHGAGTLNEAIGQLRAEEFDLVVIDPGLPGEDISREGRLSVVERVIETHPQGVHVVVTGLDSTAEGEACKELGAAAYVAKTGLRRADIAPILQEISETGFCLRLSHVKARHPDLHYSQLSEREQMILDFMRHRPHGMRRGEIFEKMAQQLDVKAESAERYYKRARAKLLKNGALPKELL